MELPEVDFTAQSDTVIDRVGVVRAALAAAGVPAPLMPEFAQAAEVIVCKESAWEPNAVTPFGGGKVMADGAPFNAQRGLTQLTPWAFAHHHALGSSARIYDPAANIAAAWRLVGATGAVDLQTGRGLANLGR
ncbi:MAG: transglycosylase SLT domain-containing protein [Desulfobacterales bacterium]|nr:transglycosylase SLT domain-containing protein [Desulfobacterales bacterium]